MSDVVGKKCHLLVSIRDASGKSRFKEEDPEIVREVNNLDRRMYLVRFTDGVTTFLFPDEVEIVEETHVEDSTNKGPDKEAT